MREDEAERTAWFATYVKALESGVLEAASGGPHRCPCCFKRTLDERGGFEVCAVCLWEDDGQDDRDADTVRGGPNGGLSLTTARGNYLRYGACQPSAVPHVRAPRPDEL